MQADKVYIYIQSLENKYHSVMLLVSLLPILKSNDDKYIYCVCPNKSPVCQEYQLLRRCLFPEKTIIVIETPLRYRTPYILQVFIVI